MSLRRRALVTVALLSVGTGTSLALVPTLAAESGLSRVMTAVGNGYLLVAGTGVIALLLTIAVATAWVMDGPEQVTMPDPEAFVPVDPPGGEFDVAVADHAGQHERAARDVGHREKIRARLRADAVTALVVYRGYDRAAAVAAVDSGEWTSDRFAAAFLGDDSVQGPRWYQRLWRWLKRENPFANRANRAADEVCRLAERER